MGVRYFEAYSDSKLIISQVKGEYEVRHEDQIPYHHAAIKLANSFDSFYIRHMSRLLNTKAVSLAVLAVTLALPTNTTFLFTVAIRHLLCTKYDLEVNEVHTNSTNFEQRTGNFRSSTTLCMAYCLMILRKRILFDEDLLGSTMMQW